MNENDTSIVKSILKDYNYKIVEEPSQAEVQLLMTCAIRESAESKIWTKLKHLKTDKTNPSHPLKQVGLLGCMAERLKDKILLKNETVDVVAGPDTYRDLPRLLNISRDSDNKGINCQYMFDETYEDIKPATGKNDVTSYISITRGCDNLCSFCIVPFTRGKERSKPITSILDEVRALMDRGIKEVTLLGQNVNSYRDLSTQPDVLGRHDLMDRVVEKQSFASGFKTVYKPRQRGITFDVLLEEVAKVNPELRVRFTSPHPKDFTDDVIDVMSRYPNIAKCIHLPAQSGSTEVLHRMRRGHTREAYLQLVERLRSKMPNLAITTDIISGFCGETDKDHQDTVDLIKQVRFNLIYMFKYSMRDKTHAYHALKDDVVDEVKQARLVEIKDLYRQQAEEIHQSQVGSEQLVLIESESKRSKLAWQGRTDTYVKTIIPKMEVFSLMDNTSRPIKRGDYVVCKITAANSQTFHAEPIQVTTMAEYYKMGVIRSAIKQSN